MNKSGTNVFNRSGLTNLRKLSRKPDWISSLNILNIPSNLIVILGIAAIIFHNEILESMIEKVEQIYSVGPD